MPRRRRGAADRAVRWLCAARAHARAAPSRTSSPRPLDQAVHGGAGLLPQRRPCGDLLRDRPRRLPRRRAGRRPFSARRPRPQPLQLLEAGRADMAISYEPELLLARDQGAKLVSIGALVQRPLTSIISINRSDHERRRSRRQDGRHRRHPLPERPSCTRPSRTPASSPASVKEIDVGFNLLPAMLSGTASMPRSAASGTTRRSSCA